MKEKLTGNFGTLSENGKENFDWTGTRTRDPWINVPALAHLSYPALWTVVVPNSQLVFNSWGQSILPIFGSFEQF